MMPTANYDVICLDKSGPADGEVCQTDNANVYWYADGSTPGELESNDLDAVRSMLAKLRTDGSGARGLRDQVVGSSVDKLIASVKTAQPRPERATGPASATRPTVKALSNSIDRRR